MNLLDASVETECREQNDVVGVFASMDCPDTVHCGFQYLLQAWTALILYNEIGVWCLEMTDVEKEGYKEKV